MQSIHQCNEINPINFVYLHTRRRIEKGELIRIIFSSIFVFKRNNVQMNTANIFAAKYEEQ